MDEQTDSEYKFFNENEINENGTKIFQNFKLNWISSTHDEKYFRISSI